MGLGVPGASAIIWYNDANNRVGNIELNVPAGWEASARIWRSGGLIYTRAYLPGTYSETVPGNLRMVLVTEDGVSFFDLPPDITWSVNFASIGN